MHNPRQRLLPNDAARWKRRAAGRFLRASTYLGACGFLLGNLWIELRARGRVFTDLEELPPHEVALVLGTSNCTHGGHANPFFAGRIAAAAQLYHSGKARQLLLSGANPSPDYDEPTTMRAALRERGVPESATVLDYAGFRTLDSFARAREVFGVSQLIIVTDDFHAGRAILLARHFGIDAVAFTSEPVPFRWSKKTRGREVLARCRALLDVYLLRTQPRFPD
ncbi:hypothetical protein BH20VER1_BH20VER1_18310 [soil metagenome]